MSDITERLRGVCYAHDVHWEVISACDAAADEIDRLLATLKTAEKLAVKHAQEAGLLAAELDALRKQEPVAWKIWHPTSSMPAELSTFKARADEAEERGLHAIPLYSAPVPPDAVAVPDERQLDAWHETEAHKQADKDFCSGWNACREKMLASAPALPAQRVPDGMMLVRPQWVRDFTAKNSHDHACSKCVPHSEILIDGYVCPYHRALDMLAAAQAQEGKP